MTPHALTPDQVAESGEKIYQQQLRDKVECEHRGRFLVLDIVSGDYEIDDRDVVASGRLLERRPEGILYGVRIGHPTAYRLGKSFAASVT